MFFSHNEVPFLFLIEAFFFSKDFVCIDRVRYQCFARYCRLCHLASPRPTTITTTTRSFRMLMLPCEHNSHCFYPCDKYTSLKCPRPH